MGPLHSLRGGGVSFFSLLVILKIARSILPLIKDFLCDFRVHVTLSLSVQQMHALKLHKEGFNQLPSVTVNYVIPVGWAELPNRISAYKIKLSMDC